MSFADALTRPAITPPGGVTDLFYLDSTTTPGATYFYVVQAESTDFPDCGDGPLVAGSTATANAGPEMDFSNGDTTPPTSNVGAALRATWHTDDTVDFIWPTAPALLPEETYLILRSDDDPQSGFILYDTTLATTWTDPDAPPTWSPTHVWFYDVRVADACNNLSLD